MKDIDKERDADCRFLRNGKCSIHVSKPGLCAVYECLWLQGALQSQDKPSRVGLVFDTLVRQDEDIPVVCARKIRPGPLSRRAKLIIRHFAEKMVVVVAEDGHTVKNVMGPDAMVDEYLRRVEQHKDDPAPQDVIFGKDANNVE